MWSTCAYDNVTASASAAGADQGQGVGPAAAVRRRCPTQFPSPITLGAGFDDQTWRAMADVSSTEARALYAHNKRIRPTGGAAPAKSLEGPLGLSFYAPNLNLMRDPRWGRTEEVPSEDPKMNGRYGAAFVKGFQEGDGSTWNSPYIKGR